MEINAKWFNGLIRILLQKNKVLFLTFETRQNMSASMHVYSR